MTLKSESEGKSLLRWSSQKRFRTKFYVTIIKKQVNSNVTQLKDIEHNTVFMFCKFRDKRSVPYDENMSLTEKIWGTCRVYNDMLSVWIPFWNRSFVHAVSHKVAFKPLIMPRNFLFPVPLNWEKDLWRYIHHKNSSWILYLVYHYYIISNSTDQMIHVQKTHRQLKILHRINTHFIAGTQEG